MKNKKGFTLIEIMVVISTIAALSSIILASLKDAQAKARDSNRIQQVRHLDTATRSYVFEHSSAPTLQGTCEIGDTVSQNNPCIAKSNATIGSPERTAWDKYMDDLDKYITREPVDPCGPNGCTGVSGENTGYTYIAPAAVEYLCDSLGTCNINNYNESYQISANLETSPEPNYGGGGYTGTLALPTGPSISMSPSSITIPSNGQVTVTLTFPPGSVQTRINATCPSGVTILGPESLRQYQNLCGGRGADYSDYVARVGSVSWTLTGNNTTSVPLTAILNYLVSVDGTQNFTGSGTQITINP